MLKLQEVSDSSHREWNAKSMKIGGYVNPTLYSLSCLTHSSWGFFILVVLPCSKVLCWKSLLLLPGKQHTHILMMIHQTGTLFSLADVCSVITAAHWEHPHDLLSGIFSDPVTQSLQCDHSHSFQHNDLKNISCHRWFQCCGRLV